MAVVTKYGSAMQDPAVKPADLLPAETNGGLKHLISTVEIANGDSANSVLKFGKIPSNARIHPLSEVHHDAVTSVNDFDLGCAADPDALADGLDISSAGKKSAVAAVNRDSYHKQLWQLLAGVTADPNGELEIIGTLKAAATAAGTVTLSLFYTTAN